QNWSLDRRKQMVLKEIKMKYIDRKCQVCGRSLNENTSLCFIGDTIEVVAQTYGYMYPSDKQKIVNSIDQKYGTFYGTKQIKTDQI
ncbi:MAG: hypothetical protein RSA24_05500, partial [Clostridia bacterium]